MSHGVDFLTYIYIYFFLGANEWAHSEVNSNRSNTACTGTCGQITNSEQRTPIRASSAASGTRLDTATALLGVCPPIRLRRNRGRNPQPQGSARLPARAFGSAEVGTSRRYYLSHLWGHSLRAYCVLLMI